MSYSISEVAQAFDLSVSALRYYDEIGLVPASGRRGRVRMYDSAALQLLAYVQLLHTDGMLSVAATQAVVQAARAGDRAAIFRHQSEELERSIQRLSAARDLLLHQQQCTSADSLNCPVTGELLHQRAAQALATLPDSAGEV